MKLSVGATVVALSFLATHPAVAQSTCTRDAETRIVDVKKPGVVGQMCDVVIDYGDTTKTPFHANNSADFCAMKAADLVRDLEADGFSCVTGLVAETERLAPPALAAAPAPTPAAAEPAVTTPAVEEPVVAAASAEAAMPPAPTSQPEAIASNETPAPAPAAAAQTRLAEPAAPESLSQAAPKTVASAGPAHLTAGVTEPVRTGQRSSVVGRIVGAEAVDPGPPPARVAATSEGAAPVVQAALQEPAPAPEVEQAVIENAKRLRKPADDVRATLNAQIAAWNEGDLEGFMQTYWKSDDLRFVSDSGVAKGWSATMKRYRDKYGDAQSLGRLALEKTNVEMVTDDVAIVSGRYSLTQSEAASTGQFSLVMKRMDGAWRIVHDHSSADPATN